MPSTQKLFEPSEPFQTGQFVRNVVEVQGVVQAYRPELHPTDPTKNPGVSGPPGAMQNETVKIPPGNVGEVMYSDPYETIVMFPIHSTTFLEPHLIKVEGYTSDFKRTPRRPEKNPFIWQKDRGLKDPGKPMMSNWKKAAVDPNDPLEWGGGQGPHAQLLDAQEVDWWNRDPETQKQAIMNALRVAILSPMKLLKHNAIHYQDIAHIPYNETNPEVYINAMMDKKEKWNRDRSRRQMKDQAGGEAAIQLPGLEDSGPEQAHLDPLMTERYPGVIFNHLRYIADLSKFADYLHKAALEDLQQGGSGKIWRQALRNTNVPGVNDKVASFSWLLLAPKTSQLATIDTHMVRALGVPFPSNTKQYDDYENALHNIKAQMGYHDMPLGAFQWGVWDYVRSGPGTHQLHDSMKPLDYTPYWETDWHDTNMGGSGEYPPGWNDMLNKHDELKVNKPKPPKVPGQVSLLGKWKRANNWRLVYEQF